MTKQEAIDNHRQMWRWIAEKTRERRKAVDKIDYFYETGQMDVKPKFSCWCCEYARSVCNNDNIVGGHRAYCYLCPIQWIGDNCTADTSEYHMWLISFYADDWEEAARWAAVIAELPEVQE